MMVRIWSIDCNATSHGRGSDAAWAALIDRGITFNGMQALRFSMVLVQKPTYEQLAEWESQAGEDPWAYTALGEYFAELKHYDDAIRMYERSIALSPTKDAFVSLANTYRLAGQDNMWQPTLERFLEGESLGLEQASVHSMIANDLMEKGKLDEARTHAVAAAETWSAWGLELASQVDEALGQWEESEKWISEMARNYPTSSACEWYFWCRRTGRGSVQQARKFTDAYFKADSIKTNANGQLTLMTFHILENDSQAAYDDAKKSVALANQQHAADDDMVYKQVHVALLARELKDKDAADAAIKETRRLSESFRAKYGPFSDVNVAVCDVLDGKPLTEEARAKVDHGLENDLNKDSRCNYQYFLGRAFDLAGNKELAEKYWKKCVTRGPFSRYNATLAGKYLCDRSKTSRP
jgi:tetratricopeptide (TPR) repeat protein